MHPMSDLPLFGHIPTFKQKLYRIFSKIIINALSLNEGSRFSCEFAKLLDPKKYIKIPHASKGISFSTSHGRLLWRAETLLTEEPLAVEWINSFTDNDTFLDVGANVGTYALLAKRLKPAMQVYAAELDYNNIYLMYKNFVTNGLQHKVLFFPFALAETRRISRIHNRDLSQGNALQSMDKKSLFETLTTDKAHIFEHLTYPLDDLIVDYKLRQPSMIKVDVDGNELEVLEGSRKTLINA
jgi:FkbM family methyltransferase